MKKYLISILLINLSNFLVGQSIISDGLVAYYPLNGNANDMSIYDDHGEILGAIPTEDRFGRSNSAFYFNANLSSAIITSGENLPLGSDPRTVSFWYKADEMPSTPLRNGWMLTYGNASGQVAGEVFAIRINSDGNFSIDGNMQIYNTYENENLHIYDGEWHHVAVVLHSATFVTCHYDGKLVSWASFPPPGSRWETSASSLFIGYYAGQYFDGCIDDVRIYNKTFTGSDIQELYNYEKQPMPRFKSVKTALKLEIIAEVSHSYILQYTDDLETQNWSNFGEEFVAEESLLIKYVDADEEKRFWRITEVSN